MPCVRESEPNEIMCIPKHSLRSGLGARSVLRRSPASGSAERHLPFPHKSAPVGRSISTGDGRRVSAQPRHTVVFHLTKPTSQWRHQSHVPRDVLAFGLSFHVFFFSGEERVCACVRAWGGREKDEDNCRFPWMMMSRDERRLVVRSFCSEQKVTKFRLVLQKSKREFGFMCPCCAGWGTVLIQCNLLFPSRITLYCNCIMNQLDAGL